MNQPVYVAPNRKGIPYGMMNFAAIRRDNYYYVDKTHFIPRIEQANRFFFFIRPRRFGKSLTLSVLQHYYDIHTRDDFDVLFGDLYIGQHPTPSRNSYLVLYLNFSGISGELNDYPRIGGFAIRRCPSIRICNPPLRPNAYYKKQVMSGLQILILKTSGL